jgi:hypothetical protein
MSQFSFAWSKRPEVQPFATLKNRTAVEIAVLRSCAESGINVFLIKRLLLFFIISAAFTYSFSPVIRFHFL